MRVQEHMIEGLKRLGDEVQPVIFTDEPYYQQICEASNGALMCSSAFETNRYHMPYVRSFIKTLESLPISCSFYGYVNGDILVSPSLMDVLHHIQLRLHDSPLLIVGRRTNYPWKNVTTLLPDDAYLAQLDAICSSDVPYMSNAIVGTLFGIHRIGPVHLPPRHVPP